MLAALGLLLPAAAMAQSVSPAVFVVDAGSSDSEAPGPSMGSACNGSHCSFATASAIYVSNAPLLSATAYTDDVHAPTIYLYDEVIFYFMIEGPSTVQAPIELFASGSASETGDTFSGMIIADIILGHYFLTACNGSAGGPCGASSFSGLFQAGMFYTNTQYQVTYRITGRDGGEDSTGSVSATLDPDIMIDPSWLTENPGYSLTVSPSPSPEPGAWALMILGFGALGAALRARRRAAIAS
jgi:hypothetical protein